VPDGWQATPGGAVPRGWEVDAVVHRYVDRLPEFRSLAEGTGPVAVPLTPAVTVGANAVDQNTLLVLAHALLWAARGRDGVAVLDWGGGFGYASFAARALLPDDVVLGYTCIDLPTIMDAARPIVPEVRFVDEDCAFASRYDLTMSSSAMQYAVDWPGLVARLAAATDRYLLLTDVPFVLHAPSFVVLQRTQTHGIDTEYLGWVLNRQELVGTVEATGLHLVREYALGFRPRVHAAPERPRTGAFLFGVG